MRSSSHGQQSSPAAAAPPCAQVQFLGAVTKTEPYMIVTEYMPGGSLTDMFKAAKRLSMWRAVQVRKPIRCTFCFTTFHGAVQVRVPGWAAPVPI